MGSSLKLKMEEMTLKQKSATEEKLKLESENKKLNERGSKNGDMEKAITSTKENMTKEVNAQKETVMKLETKVKEEQKSSAQAKQSIDTLKKEKEELNSKLSTF